MRIDLHVHSDSSTHPNEWILRQLGAQESYTDPEDLYRIAKARGMDAVTITDHNTIEGCLSIAHHEDVFLSCEYTTYFRTDGCKAHVLCYNITPEQHQQIQEVRSDIFALVAFLKEHGIVHSLAHALFAPNSKLTPDHFQRFLELFDTWEINGAKDSWANECLRKILDKVKPHRRLTAGSDDHSSLTVGRMWTEVPGATTIQDFLEGLTAGKAIIGGEASTPHTLAWNIYSVGWQWLKHTNVVNGSLSTVDRYLLPPEIRRNGSFARTIRLHPEIVLPKYWAREIALSFVGRELEKTDDSLPGELSNCDRWFHLVDSVTSSHMVKLGNRILSEVAARDLHGIFSNVGLPLALYLLLAPYLVAYGKFASQRRLGEEISRRLMGNGTDPAKVAKFTDTFGTVDGVSLTLDEQLRQAMRTGKDYTIVACVGENGRQGLKLFEPLGVIDTPEFNQQKLCWPPLLKILDYCYSERFTLIQAATPGPLGLAAMITAKTLGLPFQAVYHTHIPEFVGKVTDDPFLEALFWKYCLWFYDTADVVFTPSEHIKRELVQHGLRPQKITVYPRGIDSRFFSPAKRTTYWEDKWGVAPQRVKALYVGRVSREKNLPLLAGAFKKLVQDLTPSPETNPCSSVTLLVVGDGGYLEEMKSECAGYPVVFTGELRGDELAEAYASADFFVFPSTTDTYGRVVLEAMASGLACIITDVGGPKENVVHGLNGLTVPGDDDAALTEAMLLMAFGVDRKQMCAAARQSTESKSLTESFDQYWSLYAA